MPIGTKLATIRTVQVHRGYSTDDYNHCVFQYPFEDIIRDAKRLLYKRKLDHDWRMCDDDGRRQALRPRRDTERGQAAYVDVGAI